MTKRNRMMGAVAGLLLLSIVLSACGGAAPAPDWPGLTVAGSSYQVTIDGKPLYYHANDAKAGDTVGQGKGGAWYVVQMSAPPAAPASASGEQPTVSVASHPTLGNILVDGSGMTLYTYAQDTENTSNCGADCTPTWPPLTVAAGTTPTAGEGVTGTVGVIERADNILYVISGSPEKVYLVNAENGDVDTDDDVFDPLPKSGGTFYWTPVTLGGGLAFVGLGVPEEKVSGLYAFEPKTGAQQWDKHAEGIIMAAPVYDDGTVYFGTSSGWVYAVDVQAQDIRQGWPVQLGSSREAIWGSPLVAEGSVYVPSLDHNVYCLDADTGEQKWVFRAQGAVAAQPTLDPVRKVLYFGDFTGHVYAVDADSGRALSGFSFRAGNWIWSEVLLARDRLYVTAMDGKLYALNPATGGVLEGFPVNADQRSGRESSSLRAAPVLLDDDSILVASYAGYVTALNADNGKEEWQWPEATVGSILTTPVVVRAAAGTDAPGKVYVVMMGGQVYALDAAKGSKDWDWPGP